MQNLLDQSIELANLRAIFVAKGFDVWFVGGCTRDTLLGLSPKDIDLATSANPEEQMAIYEEAKIKFFETGLQHGTLTVVLDQPYEITSLRTETNHDGRHADVSFTRDLAADLSRRDLTINAIALSFDGEVIDPFGGLADLEAGRVRFVGEPFERMREDYLRILRFFRFHARFAGEAEIDGEAKSAIQQAGAGLAKISVERIWSEMSRIISGPFALPTLLQMEKLGLFRVIGLPQGRWVDLQAGLLAGITNPASLMGCYLLEGGMRSLANSWKWSRAEKDRAVFMARHTINPFDEAMLREMLVDGVDRDWVLDLARFQGAHVEIGAVMDWEVPEFPVRGADLIARGMKPSPEITSVLTDLRKRWKTSLYQESKEELLSGL